MISGTKLHRFKSTHLKVERLRNRDRLFAVLAQPKRMWALGLCWVQRWHRSKCLWGRYLANGKSRNVPPTHETPYCCIDDPPHIPKKALPSIQKTTTDASQRIIFQIMLHLFGISIYATYFQKVKRNNSFQNKNDTIFKNSLIILEQNLSNCGNRPEPLQAYWWRFAQRPCESRFSVGGKSIQIHQKPAVSM